jgi:hypothetical protein
MNLDVRKFILQWADLLDDGTDDLFVLVYAMRHHELSFQ